MQPTKQQLPNNLIEPDYAYTASRSVADFECFKAQHAAFLDYAKSHIDGLRKPSAWHVISNYIDMIGELNISKPQAQLEFVKYFNGCAQFAFAELMHSGQFDWQELCDSLVDYKSQWGQKNLEDVKIDLGDIWRFYAIEAASWL